MAERVRAGAYLDAACALTERAGSFNRYQLAREVEEREGMTEFSVSSKSAGAWLRRMFRTGRGIDCVSWFTPGRGGVPKDYVAVEILMMDWRKRSEVSS